MHEMPIVRKIVKIQSSTSENDARKVTKLVLQIEN